MKSPRSFSRGQILRKDEKRRLLTGSKQGLHSFKQPLQKTQASGNQVAITNPNGCAHDESRPS
jgi:hypothetical protein